MSLQLIQTSCVSACWGSQLRVAGSRWITQPTTRLPGHHLGQLDACNWQLCRRLGHLPRYPRAALHSRGASPVIRGCSQAYSPKCLAARTREKMLLNRRASKSRFQSTLKSPELHEGPRGHCQDQATGNQLLKIQAGWASECHIRESRRHRPEGGSQSSEGCIYWREQDARGPRQV